MPLEIRNTFPLSHEQAVSILINAEWSPSEQKFLDERHLTTLHKPVGDVLIKWWFLDQKSYPLPRSYMRRFALGSADDMTALIIKYWICFMRDEKFDLAQEVHSLRQTWINQGIDPVTLEKSSV